MYFVESLLKTSPDKLSVEIIQTLVDKKVEENLNLDYKSISAFNDADGLSKAVSAFANSAGGLIILGVEEEKSNGGNRIYPTRIDGGPEEYTKEALEQRLAASIQPRITNLRIFPIRFSGKVLFVFDIPQSETPPHMAKDYRYYLRHNFMCLPMEHYQVADMFGRRRTPRLELHCELTYGGSSAGERRRIILKSKVLNVGHAIAKNWLIILNMEGANFLTQHKDDGKTGWKETKTTFPIRLDAEEPSFVIYPELPKVLADIDFELEVDGEIKLDFTLASEDMQLIKDRWDVRYDDFPELGYSIPHTVASKQ